MFQDATIDCPIDKKCYYTDTHGKMHKCRAYQSFPMENTLTGDVKEEWKCSIYEWPVIFARDAALATRSSQAATESMRNETVMRQDLFLDAINTAKKRLSHE